MRIKESCKVTKWVNNWTEPKRYSALFSLSHYYRCLSVSLLPSDHWRKNGITRKIVPIMKTLKDLRTIWFWKVRIVLRLIFKNKDTSNLNKGKSHLPRLGHGILFGYTSHSQSFGFNVCDNLINSVCLSKLKIPLTQGFQLLFCSP